MDIASIIGLVLGVGLVVAAILTGGGSFAAFVDAPSIMIVFGGSIAAALLSYPFKNFLGVFRIVWKAFCWKVEGVPDVIAQIVNLSGTARRDGLLALENRLCEIDNEYLALGIQLAVDGTRPEVMEDILRTELNAVATRHRDGKAILDCMGRFAPAFGMIGTLLGLIIMLGDMNDPSTIGSGMAVALLTTLYGALAANVFFLPLAEKLGYINKQELLLMEVILRGVMAIQLGENPRIIDQKLNTFVPLRQRTKLKVAA